MTGQTISGCCEMMSPCEALCMLQNAEIKLAMGETITSYKVGGETFTFARPSTSGVKALINKYQALCNVANGKPARRRAKVCLVYGEHTCGSCYRVSSRCRCG